MGREEGGCYSSSILVCSSEIHQSDLSECHYIVRPAVWQCGCPFAREMCLYRRSLQNTGLFTVDTDIVISVQPDWCEHYLNTSPRWIIVLHPLPSGL